MIMTRVIREEFFRLSPLELNRENFGQLEICYDAYWGNVCNNFITDMTAAIALDTIML